MDFAAADGEVNALQRLDAGKALGETTNLKQRAWFQFPCDFLQRQARCRKREILAPVPVKSVTQLSALLRANRARLVFPFGQFRRRLRLLEDAFLSLDALGQGLLRHDRLNGIEKLRADQRIALDSAIELACRHRLERAAHAINRNDEDVFARLDARLLHRLDRAERHIVVVREERGDVLAIGTLEKRLHDFLALWRA